MSSLLPSQPIWRKPNKIPSSIAIQPDYLPWLLDKGSLTKKLTAKSKGHFSVEVLQQSIQAIPFSESKALRLSHRQWAVIREVVLYGNNTPWVYARTVIPLSTLQGPLRRLHYLGNQSLGGQLFSDPSMRREAVEIALLSDDYFSQTALHQARKKIDPVDSTWGRRSVFRLSNKPLLVSEIFLPALFLSHTHE